MNGTRLRRSSKLWMMSFTSHLIPAVQLNQRCVRHTSPKKKTVLTDHGGGYRVFCNPPYSRIADWVQKAYYESLKPDTLVCLLIPARTDTKYFHDYILHRSEIRFVKGRLKFSGARYNAPFPSMIVIFRSAKTF